MRDNPKTTIIDRVNGRNTIDFDKFDQPPPLGIPIYVGEDSFIVSREFIDHYAKYFKAMDAVRENDGIESNSL